MHSDWRDFLAIAGPGPHTVVGTLKVHPWFHSPQLDNDRRIYVYLPPSYFTSHRRYPVLYMHDGQNLFSVGEKSPIAPGEWRVDETMEDLSREGIEAIVVGVENMAGRRGYEYSLGAGGRTYLAFLVETLKPTIDAHFRTEPGRTTTGLLGSSLGAQISLLGFFNYRSVFGFAGGMSPVTKTMLETFVPHVRRQPVVPGKLYLDDGTAERSHFDGEPLYRALVDRGYRPGREVCYVKEAGGEHNELAWARRLPNALRFLLG